MHQLLDAYFFISGQNEAMNHMLNDDHKSCCPSYDIAVNVRNMTSTIEVK